MLNMFSRKNMEMKGISQLMYRDVSSDKWDKINLTSANLNYSMDSLIIIDQYIMRLQNTELINQNFNNLVYRIGSYVGEVIRINSSYDFQWYDYNTVKKVFSFPTDHKSDLKNQALLYSKKINNVVLPLAEISNFLKGKSMYSDLTHYAAASV